MLLTGYIRALRAAVDGALFLVLAAVVAGPAWHGCDLLEHLVSRVVGAFGSVVLGKAREAPSRFVRTLTPNMIAVFKDPHDPLFLLYLRFQSRV